MSKTHVQNISGQDRTVPSLGGRLVLADAVIEVDEADAEGFLQQERIWSRPSSEHKTSAKAAKKTADSATTQED